MIRRILLKIIVIYLVIVLSSSGVSKLMEKIGWDKPGKKTTGKAGFCYTLSFMIDILVIIFIITL